MKQLCLALLVSTFVVLGIGAAAFAGPEYQLEGNIELEARFFTNDVDGGDRKDVNLSGSIDPVLIMLWNRGKHTVTVNPYYRWDLNDEARSHFDIRQLSWIGAFGNLELRVGIDKVFWGVTESAHLVDIINQDDGVEDIDGEDKLGQPLVSASYWSDYGTLTVFLMPYFRERTFAGPDGRPRGPLTIDTDRPTFGQGTNNWHPDWAVRYQNSFGIIDVAASYFSGFSRNPDFVPDIGGEGEPMLRPHYSIIRQVGLEVQATVGAWLFKFEGVNVDKRDGQDHQAFAAGFEYTFYQAFGSGADVGVITEYLWDSRGATGPSPSESDIFVGVRWEGNDVKTTRVLAGVVFDLDSQSRLFFVEASRRIGSRWRITLDGRFFLTVPVTDPLFFIRRDDFVQLRLARFF
jgi:hypothetical protein